MKTIWLLVYVHHGFIQEPEIFYDETDLQKRRDEIMMNFNEDYDELETFEKVLSEEKIVLI